MGLNKVRVFIVQSKGVVNDKLLDVLNIYFPEVEITGVENDVKKAISLIVSLEPDVIFLDVNSKNEDNFLVIERLMYHFNFVITSSEDKYALKAIDMSVMGYLLKPIKLDALITIINKVKRMATTSQNQGYYNDNDMRVLALPSLDKIELIEKKDIVYLQADGRYTNFLLTGGVTKLACKNIGEFEKLLGTKDFFRIHHSYIVNISHILNINKAAGNYIELKEGRGMIPVAKRKFESFNRYINGRENVLKVF